jgi:hypothetical protein
MAWSFHITSRLATLDYQHLGTLSLIEGREIRVTLLPDADGALVTSHLTTTALAVLLYQRGLVVLKASAVAINGKAVVFLFEPNSRSCSLIEALVQRGHRMLADRFTAIDVLSDQPLVLLRHPLVQALAPRGRPLDSQRHNQGPTPAAEATPLVMIVYLQAGMANSMSSLAFRNSLSLVTHHSYPNCLLQPSDIPNVRRCSQIAGTVPLSRLVYRPDANDLPMQASLVEAALNV